MKSKTEDKKINKIFTRLFGLLIILTAFICVIAITTANSQKQQAYACVEEARILLGLETYDYMANLQVDCCSNDDELYYNDFEPFSSTPHYVLAGQRLRTRTPPFPNILPHRTIGTLTANAICNETGRFGIIGNEQDTHLE